MNLQTVREIAKRIKINEGVYHVHGLEDNVVKMSTVPKLFYRFNAISIIIPTFLWSVTFSKMYMKIQWIMNSHAIPE